MARFYSGLDVQSDMGGLFPWKSKMVDVGGGVRQAVVDVGPKTSPITFVLLHGNPTWGFLYRRFISHLSTRFRVIVPDHVGFGRSDKPNDPAYYTVARHIANLDAVLRELKAKNIVLVLHDWGGPIGMGWATRHAAALAGVVVLNTWAWVKHPPMELPWVFRLLVLGKGGWKRNTQNGFFTEFLIPKATARKLTQQEMDGYRAPHPTPQDRAGVARFPQLIPQTHDPTHPTWGLLAAIEDALPVLADKPALIVWAMKDPAFRKDFLSRWQSLFRKVDGPHKIAQASHYLQEDAPEEILGRIDAWVATTWPAGRSTNGSKARNPRTTVH